MKLLVLLILTPFTLFSQGKFFGGNGDGYHMATMNAVVLPIKIESFRVKVEENKRMIELKLSPASTPCLIALERSQNFVGFQPIDSVENSNGVNKLSFVFVDPSPQSFDIYYRCMIADCNGQLIYTQVYRVQQTEEYPTIFYSVADRSVHYDLKEEAELLLFDALGRVIIRRKIGRGQGKLRLPSLLNGIYFLKLGQSSTTTIVL